MTEFCLKLADISIGVQARFPSTKEYCREYLTADTPAFTVELTAEDIVKEQIMAKRQSEREGRPVPRYSETYLETVALYRHIAGQMPRYHTVLMHGAVVAVDGEGYLFTAPSGTGKTTHIRRWLEYFGDRAHIVNGDKPLLRANENGVSACGTPWQGKENYGVNEIVPLRAIVLLDRGETDCIAPAQVKDELERLLPQFYFPDKQEVWLQTLDTVDRICKAVPLFRLHCTMNSDTARVAYEGVNKMQRSGKPANEKNA